MQRGMPTPSTDLNNDTRFPDGVGRFPVSERATRNNSFPAYCALYFPSLCVVEPSLNQCFNVNKELLMSYSITEAWV